jgi:hypothetical protein
MNTFAQLVDLISPRKTPAQMSQMSRAERLYVAGIGFACALACAALWGLAAGSGSGTFAVRNLASVPMLLVVSTLASLPLGMLALRLTTAAGRPSDLLVAHSGATFAGALTLLLLAPLVALYQFSSAWAGPVVAMSTVAIAFACGVAVFVRTLRKLGTIGPALVVPVILLASVQIASLAQLASLAPPVLPTRTTFGHGIDGVASQVQEAAP